MLGNTEAKSSLRKQTVVVLGAPLDSAVILGAPLDFASSW